MELTITVQGPLSDPRQRVLALIAATRQISELGPEGDPADGTMMLLTAAVRVAMQSSGRSANSILPLLANSLGHASVAAEQWFLPRAVVVANDPKGGV